jgi:glycine betaine/proline transport system substrate-binding protein
VRRIRRTLFTVLFAAAAALAAAGCAAGGGGSSGGELTLGTIGWTENVAVSNLTKVLLEEELGYDQVELQTLDLGPLFKGVATGDLDAFQDVWLPNNRNYLNKVEEDVELLEPWYKGETKYGIAALDYMNVDSLAELERAGTNEIIGIEPGASFHPQIRNVVFKEYGLENFKLVESSTAAMLAAVEEASSNKEPILFLAWSPHWMNEVYDIVYLKDPKDAQGKFNDSSRITTVVNEDLAEEDPVAYAFLKAVSLNEEQLNSLELEIKQAGQDEPVKGVKNWLENNRDVVQPWVQAAKEARQ